MSATFSASRRRPSVSETVDVNEASALSSRLGFDSISRENQSSATINRMSGSRTFESLGDRLTRISNRNEGPFDKRSNTIQSGMEAGSWRSRQRLPTPAESCPSPVINDKQQLLGPPGVVQGFVTPGQLEFAHSYAYHRGNGHYTRLIPVDELPYDIQGIPRTQGPQGLIIVPEPRNLPQSHNIPQNNFSAPRPPAPTTPSDLIQGRIDQIVACTAVKREKVYCDKWVHTGTCAFTQVGCKFKHEMPLDKATQHQLGLFQGLPEWYKRDQAVELHSIRRSESAALRTPPDSSSRDGFATEKLPDSASTSFLFTSSSNSRFTTRPTTGIFSARPSPPPKPYFGTIGAMSYFGQARQASATGSAVPLTSSNPYEMLEEWEREVDEE